MRVYRSDWDGVDVVRLAGVVDGRDAEMLVEHLGSARVGSDWCCVLDFSRVRHVDYRAFGAFERLTRQSQGVIFSGFNDYLLSILALVNGRDTIPVFSTWHKALRYLLAERGKIGVQAAAGRTGGA